MCKLMTRKSLTEKIDYHNQRVGSQVTHGLCRLWGDNFDPHPRRNAKHATAAWGVEPRSSLHFLSPLSIQPLRLHPRLAARFL
jgi:hypothetical protein